MDDSDDFFDRAIKGYFIYRFLWACFGFGVFILGGIFFIIVWVYQEVALECDYKQKYGEAWQSVFEQYHGTLAHAHAQIAISVSAMLAIIAVLTWFCKKTFHRHKRHIHEHTVA